MSKASVSKVFIVGVPRSGSTWIAQTLGRSRDTRYVHEPDGDYEVFALKVKLGLPRHIELAVGDDAPGQARLWDAAFAGGVHSRTLRGRTAERLFDGASRAARLAARRTGHPSPRLRLALALAEPLDPVDVPPHVVVKSVLACLAVEWIADRCDPTMLVVDRHPLNVLASWDELGHGLDRVEYRALRDLARGRWDLSLPDTDAPPIVQQAAYLGVLNGALRQAALRHPDWVRVQHEDLLEEPLGRFTELCSKVGLEFSDAAAEYLRSSDKPGSGYATKRVAKDLSNRWRTQLSAEQAGAAIETLALFPAELGLLDGVDQGAV